MQNILLFSDLAKPEVLVIAKACDTISRAPQRHARRLLRDYVEVEDNIVEPELLPKRSRKEQSLVSRGIETKKVKGTKPGNKEKDE